MFDAARNYHVLDYRFKDGDKVVDLSKDYTYPLYHMPTALIKRELLNNLNFDTKIKTKYYANNGHIVFEITADYDFAVDHLYNFIKPKRLVRIGQAFLI